MKFDVSGYPRTCSTCRKPVSSKEAARFYRDAVSGEAWTWHVRCSMPEQVSGASGARRSGGAS